MWKKGLVLRAALLAGGATERWLLGVYTLGEAGLRPLPFLLLLPQLLVLSCCDVLLHLTPKQQGQPTRDWNLQTASPPLRYFITAAKSWYQDVYTCSYFTNAKKIKLIF